MDATPIHPGQIDGEWLPDLAVPPSFEPLAASAASRKWAVLHAAAAAVGGFAGLPGEPARIEVDAFPETVGRTAGWRRELAEQGIDDLIAIMEPGLAALVAAQRRGADARAAAQALWREFVTARDALLTLTAGER